MKFIDLIKPEYASDMVVLVQPLDQNTIILFDRKGRGEVWEKFESDKFRQGKRLSVSEQICMHRALSYTDKNGVRLILSYTDDGKNIYVYDPDEDYGYAQTVEVGCKFQLVKRGDKLYMVSDEIH